MLKNIIKRHLDTAVVNLSYRMKTYFFTGYTYISASSNFKTDLNQMLTNCLTFYHFKDKPEKNYNTPWYTDLHGGLKLLP